MKTKLFTLFLATLLSINVKAQLPGWQWAKSGGGTFPDNVKGMDMDASGNIYIAGSFQSQSVSFGSNALLNADVTGSTNDIYIVKYDPSGNVIWAKRAGSPSSESITGMSCDAAGNVFITGAFYGTVCAIGNTTLTNSNIYTEIYIAKFDGSGNALWAKSIAGDKDDFGGGISADQAGNVFITGYFASSTLAPGTTTLTNASGYYDVFVAKYDASGNVLWAKKIGGTMSEYCSSITIDASGNALITGSFESPTLSFGSTTLTNSGTDIFTGKYDASGNELWIQKSTGPSGFLVAGGKVTSDAAGNVLISGIFSSSLIAFGTTTLALGGYATTTDLYLVKYDAAGSMLWAKSAGGEAYDHLGAITTDAAGNVFMTGSFSSTLISFGTNTLASTAVGDNAYFAKYDAAGNALWVEGFTTASSNTGNDICTDGAGNVLITGVYTSSLSIGGTILTNTGTAGPADIYIAKSNGGAAAVGMKENTQLRFNLYPNPFSTQLVLQADQPMKNASVTIIDCLGKTVKQVNGISGSKMTLQRDDLPAGIYFLSLTQDNSRTITEKIIITD